jgi:prephenate dehydrogenase
MLARNLVVVGVGLIGGSLAAAARGKGIAQNIIGIEPNPDSAAFALEHGLVDEVVDKVPANADFIALCVPSDLVAEWVIKLADHAGTIIDVGSVKAPIVDAVLAAPPRIRNFVPCHPISGSEKSGPAAANPQLFDGCAVVLTPLPEGDEEKLAVAQEFWQQLGTQVYVMPAADHDQALAVTSHLPHLLAFAFMQQVQDGHMPLTGGGFRDFTRIAGADEQLWWRILRLNKQPVLESAQQFIGDLQQLIEFIEQNDSEQGLARLRNATQKKRDAKE